MKSKLFSILAALVLVFTASVVSTDTASAATYCHPSRSTSSGWHSTGWKAVGSSGIELKDFISFIRIAKPGLDRGLYGSAQTYIELRQSNGLGTANLGLLYNRPEGSVHFFVWLRGSDGKEKLDSIYDAPSSGDVGFEIEHTYAQTFKFYVYTNSTRTFLTEWTGYGSGEFVANQMTLINGTDNLAVQLPGTTSARTRFVTNQYTSQWGTGVMPTGTGFDSFLSDTIYDVAATKVIGNDNRESWDKFCS